MHLILCYTIYTSSVSQLTARMFTGSTNSLPPFAGVVIIVGLGIAKEGSVPGGVGRSNSPEDKVDPSPDGVGRIDSPIDWVANVSIGSSDSPECSPLPVATKCTTVLHIMVIRSN